MDRWKAPVAAALDALLLTPGLWLALQFATCTHGSEHWELLLLAVVAPPTLALASVVALPLAVWGARASPRVAAAVLAGHGASVVAIGSVLAFEAATRGLGLTLLALATIAWLVAVAALRAS